MSELEKKVLEGNLEADEVKEEKEEVAMETETAAPEEAVEKPEEECVEEDTAEQEDQTCLLYTSVSVASQIARSHLTV